MNKLYGFKTGDKHYTGLIEKIQGKKVGKSCIMIPIEHKNYLFELLKHYKVNAKVIQVYG